ncbi:MAG TPA: hypothetical protein VHO25_23615 [Polyangiaceae bacterium]|nr:hypothetical protein [Polyangiaceae bacterium]
MAFPSTSFISVPKELLPAETIDIGDDYDSDWFDYGINHVDGTSTRLIGNHDGRYLLIRPRHRRVEGVLSPQRLQLLESNLALEKTKTYLADSTEYDDPSSVDRSVEVRQMMWTTADQRIAVGYWKEGQVSPATQALLTAFDRLITSLSIPSRNANATLAG